MCGHGTIGIITFALEHGLILPATPGRLKVEVPAGVIDIAYDTDGDKVTAVSIVNVPAYVAARDIQVEVEGIGPLSVDVPFGGHYYAARTVVVFGTSVSFLFVLVFCRFI